MTEKAEEQAKRVPAFFVNAIAIERRRLAAQMGQQYGWKRNIFDAAGYGNEITIGEYKARYARHDIAVRVVDAPAEETWRRPPEIRDGNDWESAGKNTPFVTAWREFASIDDVGTELRDRKTVWHYFQRADRLAGVGRFGVLLLGFNDGLELKEPLRRSSVSGPGGFLYMSAFDEQDITIVQTNQDQASPRYGLPELYQLDMGTDAGADSKPLGTQLVHWSRVVHIAEDLQADEIFGVPRLRSVWNRLIDLEKIMAGSGEAAWRLMFKGVAVSTKEGYNLPDGEIMQQKLDAFVHGYQRFLELEGMDITEMGGEVVDPSGVANLNVAFISAATSIPQRILLGSERGELASSQDEENWGRVIQSRQIHYAEPIILRPTINRLIYAGVLPAPSSGRYVAKWPPLHDPDEGEEAETAKTAAEAVEKAVAATGRTILLPDFLQEYMPKLAKVTVVDKPAGDVAPDAGTGSTDSEENNEQNVAESEDMAALAANFRPYP